MKALITLAQVLIIAGSLLLLFCWGTVMSDESGGALFLVIGFGIFGELALVIGVVAGLIPLIASPKSYNRVGLVIWFCGVFIAGGVAFWFINS